MYTYGSKFPQEVHLQQTLATNLLVISLAVYNEIEYFVGFILKYEIGKIITIYNKKHFQYSAPHAKKNTISTDNTVNINS